MVLRRPYAFLIKHFRMIHLIITALLVAIMIITRRVYKYLTIVIGDTVRRYDALDYTNYRLYIYLVLALLLCGVIFWLLKFKDKPRKMYIAVIAGYIVIGLFMMVVFTYLHGFLNDVPDGKTMRLYRDMLSFLLIFQYVYILIMFVRGLGFDIKKFNFASDVQELNINASDSEEVEINTQIDTTNIARVIRKQNREFGYFFKEFKAIIIPILVIIVLFLGYKGYSYFTAKLKVYKENEVIGSINQVKVVDSYYSEGSTYDYVIIRFSAYKDGKQERLNTGNLTLQVGKDKYTPDKTLCSKFSNLGNCYKKQYITDEEKEYIVVYGVKKLNIQRSYLIYSDSFDNNYKVKLIMKEA